MEKEQHNPDSRDFSTISPSARSLLLLKGLTNIPFAREAAELMVAPEEYAPYPSDKDLRYWMRVVHFENRYWSIDQLLAGLPVKNIMELSSGFSFRGLATVMQPGYHYIDTDLPGVIGVKREFVDALLRRHAGIAGDAVMGGPADGGAGGAGGQDGGAYAIGANSKLEILPLNALDKDQFGETVSHFPGGELAIVNEGLLMYLNRDEKRKLCGIIRDQLKQRGGYWITADVYLKRELDADLKMDDRLARFFEQHHVQDNMFESFQAAEDLFREAGFVLDQEAATDPAKLSSLPYLMKAATPEQLSRMGEMGKIHATWRLKAL
jgi:O-methyltransferase involved in polyketide biosynthesis